MKAVWHEGPPAPHDRREALFGGRAGVEVWDLLAGRPAEPFAAVLACQLDPRGSVGPHVQQQHPEIVVCVAGEGRAEVDGASTALAPGVVVFLPHGSTLALENGSDAPLRYLIIKAKTH